MGREFAHGPRPADRKWSSARPSAARAESQEGGSWLSSTVRRPSALVEANRGFGGGGALLRQWNELSLVAGNDVEAALFPFNLGLLDPLFARRHEIPPDIARAFHCGSANQNDARFAAGSHRDRIAWPEHQKLSSPETIAGDIDLARHDIERTLLGLGVKRKRCPQRQRGVREQSFR